MAKNLFLFQFLFRKIKCLTSGLVNTCVVQVFRASENQKNEIFMYDFSFLLKNKIRNIFELEYVCSVFIFVQYIYLYIYLNSPRRLGLQDKQYQGVIQLSAASGIRFISSLVYDIGSVWIPRIKIRLQRTRHVIFMIYRVSL